MSVAPTQYAEQESETPTHTHSQREREREREGERDREREREREREETREDVVRSSPGKEEQYKVLAVCDFTSHRRRMTVVVKHVESGKVQV